jgi:hypothetical protein
MNKYKEKYLFIIKYYNFYKETVDYRDIFDNINNSIDKTNLSYIELKYAVKYKTLKILIKLSGITSSKSYVDYNKIITQIQQNVIKFINKSDLARGCEIILACGQHFTRSDIKIQARQLYKKYFEDVYKILSGYRQNLYYISKINSHIKVDGIKVYLPTYISRCISKLKAINLSLWTDRASRI